VPVRAASMEPLVAEPKVGQVSHDLRITSLVQSTYPFVFRVLRRFGLSRADADDAAQQVFLVVDSRLSDVEPGKERAFLIRTAVHNASNAHRSRRRRPEDADGDCGDGADAGPSTDELVDQRRARALLDRLLDDMPMELKAVLVLYEIEGLTMSEIAEATDVPPGTVASRLRRARAELEARVARHQGLRGETP
jgi:RNA polymerase sigma-70 factor (ECF subfamily)